MDWSTKSRDGDCEKLNSFESFVRQLMGTTPMSSFAHLLFTLRKGELQASSSQDQEGDNLKTQIKRAQNNQYRDNQNNQCWNYKASCIYDALFCNFLA